MKKYTVPGLKLGGTSFLLQAGYVPGLRFAAERCEDVALLLLETGRDGEFLPTPEDIEEIGNIADGEGASLHVHLPTDADFSTPESTRMVIDKARRAVDRVAPLHAHSFVLHVQFSGRNVSKEQRDRTAEALREIAACLPSPELLAVENLEGFPANFWDGWLDGAAYSRCLDIGHIWKDGGDPAPLLAAWRPRIRIIHLHGLEPLSPCLRDHKSLRLMPPERLDAALHPLWETGFSGVLILEVFSFDDFITSHAAILQSWERRAGA